MSPLSIKGYRTYLQRANAVIGFDITGTDIQRSINDKKCSQGGKHAYYRCLKTFYNWLYSRKSGYNLNAQDNPILCVDAPKVKARIMPSLTQEQVDYVIGQATCLRDKAIISLFADTGLRLAELASINIDDIDWQQRLIRVWIKGGRQDYAVFGERTKLLLQQWLGKYHNHNGKLWDVSYWGINILCRRLSLKTGLPCNPHTFRRTFASILAKRGVDSLHIMRLGRWESISMVERYTRSVKFDDSLKLYSAIVN